MDDGHLEYLHDTVETIARLTALLSRIILFCIGMFAPLHWAAVKGHTEIASLLISKGADINSKAKVSVLVYICNYYIIINHYRY